MKLGVLAWDTQTGLGYQAKSYIKHLPVDKIMVSDLSMFNKMPLQGWYPDATVVRGYPDKKSMYEFVHGLDVILFAETPLNYEFYDIARKAGVKTATVINYEFFDHFLKPELPLPDMFIMPSVWYFKEILLFGKKHGVRVEQLHHPIDRDEFPFRERQTHKFLHIAGKPAANDRNGTWDYMQAVPSGRVVTQDENLAQRIRKRYRHSNVYTNVQDPNYMYGLGDIMVLPRKYGGNCLPLNEALSTGMPVIMPDITPNNHILPKEWLVPAQVIGQFTPRTQINLYSVDRQAMRDKIQEAQGWNIQEQSQRADAIADTISWKTLKPKFIELLESL